MQTKLFSSISTIEIDINQDLLQIHSLADADAIKIKYLGKKGKLTDILKEMGTLPPEEKPEFGKQVNLLKHSFLTKLETLQSQLKEAELANHLSQDSTDITLPPTQIDAGTKHPINQVLDEILDIVTRLGFSIKTGPDIEIDAVNFEALNIPKDHPARDMHDTFYFNADRLLRTHTSPVQIRTMKSQKPPLKIVAPGKVYRVDADVTHSPVFHQIEGLLVDKHVTFGQLKGTLDTILRAIFGSTAKTRYRPSYFPFTEPSAEVDVECQNCKGAGCNICKQTGWLEILGAGMVNRNVFRAVGYDPDAVTGFAFGLGIERIAMLKYNITDIRLFYENDRRFLSQF